MKRAILVAMILTATSCAGLGAYQADMTQQTVQPMTMMVASPLPQTLYVVFDPAKVADEFQIQNSTHSFKGFRPFFADGLKKALAPYFADIQVVEPGFSAPAEAHAIADVKLDGVEARELNTGSLTYVALHMQWSFAARPHDAQEYLFSFSGVGVSDHTYARLEEGAQQMLKSSLAGLLEGWTEKDVVKGFREYNAPAPIAPVEAPVLQDT